MTTLENFQPEIWAHILDIACLDDGFTARSLSLVSRQIHHLSRSHLYYAVKVESVSQLLKLEDQISKSILGSMKGNGYFLKTRFLCITLPTSFFAEAYPDETFVSERIPGDTPYRPWEDGTDSDGSWRTDDFSDVESDDGASSPHEQDEQSLREELESELADITNDPACKDIGPATMSDLSDLLIYPKFSLDLFVHRVYSALRRLLDACAGTLEVLSLYFNPWKFIPPDLFIPHLLKLQRLSIYIREAKEWTYTKRTPQPGLSRPPLLFPSLKVLRMVDSFFKFTRHGGLKAHWWADIVKSCPDTVNIQIVTGARVLGYPDWKSAVKAQENINYQFLTDSIIDCIVHNHRGSNVTSQWWFDDMNGSDVDLTMGDTDSDNDSTYSVDTEDDMCSLQRDDTDDGY